MCSRCHKLRLNGMERHGRARGHKAPSLSVAEGDDTASDDNKKKGRRHYCFSLRYFVQRKQQQVRLLFLLVVGAMSLLKVTRNVNVNFHLHKTDEASASQPRVMGYYFRDSDSHSWIGTENLDFLSQPHLSHTTIDVSKRELRAQKHLLDSSAYDDGRRDELEDGDCKAQYQWQLESYPTCNLLHEHDLGLLSEEKVSPLGNGYWRDVWKVSDGAQVEHVLKTLRYEHDYEDRNYDRHRRDALATLRMTASPNVINIHAYCGNSGIFEYAYGGDLEDIIWYSDSPLNSTERLIVAYQVARAIADVHSVEENGRPSIAHTDITPSQFVYADGRYKLNDFNRCRFIAWNQKTDEQCGFYVGKNPGHVSAWINFVRVVMWPKLSFFFVVSLTRGIQIRSRDRKGGCVLDGQRVLRVIDGTVAL